MDLTPMRAIRAKCIDCSGGNRSEVTHCTVKTCPLWPYRLGRRPRIDSEEEKVHVAMGNLSMQQLSEVEAVQTVLEPEAVRSYGTKPITDEVDQTANNV